MKGQVTPMCLSTSGSIGSEDVKICHFCMFKLCYKEFRLTLIFNRSVQENVLKDNICYGYVNG